MSSNDNDGLKIYSATYSNVPVYEYNIEGKHVMRRRADDWINATHILKVADYDKPARTRILEREVQKGVHEKVQGGYGKYQGTWIPLPHGRTLAERNGALAKLLPIFDFVPGDRSPPPAPKHATAASTKPRVPRAPANQRKPVPQYAPVPDYSHVAAEDASQLDDATPDNITVASESAFDDYDAHHTASRKRRRVHEADLMSQQDKEHRLWGDELLDYLVLCDMPHDLPASAPPPPPGANLDRPIDDKGYTALHWAAAIGDIEVVKDLIRRGANTDVQAKNGETPLMRAVVFTNSFDRQNMERLAGLLIRTVNMQEWSGSTVFHHLANMTARKSRYQCARYYTDCILNRAAEVLSTDQIERVLNEQDRNGDTAVTIAARNGARKCVRSLIGRNAAVDIPNKMGETADQLIVQLNRRRQERSARQLSSSPFGGPGDSGLQLGTGGAVQAPGAGAANGRIIPFDPITSATTATFDGASQGAYKSEAALTLTTSVLPSFATHARGLASAFEAELGEKEAELAEAERLAVARRTEIEDLKRKHEALRVQELEMSKGGTETEAILEEELSILSRECEGLTEEDQRLTLAELVRQQEAEAEAAEKGADDADPETIMHEQLELAKQIVAVQHQRQELVKQIVAGVSVAGVGERQGRYKRLITGALGVREEHVEALLGEIVAELEEWRAL